MIIIFKCSYRDNRYNGGYTSDWEREFRRQMDTEWERIRKEQTDWAKKRRGQQREWEQQNDPFNNFRYGRPFTVRGMGYNDDPRGPRMVNPIDGIIRTFLTIFAFFMVIRILSTLMFGRPRNRYRDPYDPYGGYPSDHDGQWVPPYERNNRHKSRYEDERTMGRPLPPAFRDPNDLPPNRNRRMSYEDYIAMQQKYQNRKDPVYPNNKNNNDDDLGMKFDERNENDIKRRMKWEEEREFVERVREAAKRKDLERDRQYGRRVGGPRRREYTDKYDRNGNKINDDDNETPNEAYTRFINSNQDSSHKWRDRGKK